MSVLTVTLKDGTTRYVGRYGYRGKQVRFDTYEEAEAYAAAQKQANYSTTSKNPWYGWKEWVVPSEPLRVLLEKNQKYLEATDCDGLGHGWKELLAHQVALILRGSPNAAKRRIYDLCYGRVMVTSAPYAGAITMALGLDLDRDTDIPTLPGNKTLAADLIRVRADQDLDEMHVRRLARQTIRLSALILRYPHNQARLQDLAPFDCLRPPR